MGRASELVRTLLAEITLLENQIDGLAFEVRDANERMDAMKMVDLDIPHYTMNLRVGYVCQRYAHLAIGANKLQEEYDELWGQKYGHDLLDKNGDKDIE